MGKTNTQTGIQAPSRLFIPEIENDLTRRDFLVGGAAMLLLGATGCGGDAGSEEEASANTRTIEHKYGSTTIEGMPERVVSVGYTDQDPILAVGGNLVGVRNWIGDPIRFWAEDELGDAEPEILPADAINFEQVAALEPDLIIGISSGMTRDD